MKHEHANLEQLDQCPLCKSTQIEHWSEGRDRLHQINTQRFAYQRCKACDLVFQSPRPSADQIASYYPDNYGPHLGSNQRSGLKNPLRFLTKPLIKVMDRAMRRRMLIDDLERALSNIDARLNGAGTMVDFGCGSGTYLVKARQRGCNAIGVDFSPNALAEVQAKGFTALPVSDATWQTLGTGSIGFFRMNHVLEHLYDPIDTLDHIFKALKPGGFLHIATPNPKGGSALKYRENWFGLDCPRHIMLLPPETCKALLEARGFTDVHYFYDTHPKDIVRSWAYRMENDNKIRVSADVTGLGRSTTLNFLASRAVHLDSLTDDGDRYHITAQKPPHAPA